ncbi:hypothetical protein SA19202_13980 [Staphylococcus argenteus]|nr:hypothetical protein SA19105_07540 [Staphylococcus argenteus]GJF72790.1 hypothetical protein SA19202_13980 [Staphylococcus argenteus]GJF85677.1 hypothetical protein SA20015_13860 [Staphylococcus argenteus]
MLFKNAFTCMKTLFIDKVLITHLFYNDCEKLNIRIFPYLDGDFPYTILHIIQKRQSFIMIKKQKFPIK